MIDHMIGMGHMYDTHRELTDIPEITAVSLKRFREIMGLSQQELATILGIGIATIGRWERGETPTGTAGVILRTLIARVVCGLEAETLMSGSAYMIYRLLRLVFDEPPHDEKNQYESQRLAKQISKRAR